MATSAEWNETAVEMASVKLHVARAGSGRSVLVLHHDTGSPQRLDFYDALARRFDVIVPHHPGYGRSERPQWLRSVRDVAVVYQSLLAALDIDRASLIGLGFGGWIASEMATMAPREFHRLVLVGAMGVKPTEGDIFDQAIVSYLDYARAGFHDQQAFAHIYGAVSTDQLVEWDLCREMSFRIAWKPICTTQPCRISWVACAPRRWLCGATTIKLCRRAPGSAMRRCCRRRGSLLCGPPAIASRWSGRTSSLRWSAASSTRISGSTGHDRPRRKLCLSCTSQSSRCRPTRPISGLKSAIPR